MNQRYGKDKLLRADKVLETAKTVPPEAVRVEGRVVQVLFGPSYRSECDSNDELLMFYNESCAHAFKEELQKFIV